MIWFNRIRAWFRGPLVSAQQGAYGFLKEYRNGTVTFTDRKTGKESVVPADFLEIARPWRAVAAQGAGKFSVPLMSADEASEYVAERGGPVTYIDTAAGLIFYKPK